MKRLIIITKILFVNLLCYGQSGEFKIHSNGLMYSDTTMQQLEFIVDSLNLKFRACDLNRTYYSKQQAIGHFIRLEEGKIKEAKKDIANNIPFEDFIEKYPRSIVEKDLLIVKYQYKNYEDKDIIEFNSFLNDQSIHIEGRKKAYSMARKGTWVFDYWEGSEYTDEYVKGIYFSKEFKKHDLPVDYARMIQYSNCMVDTSTQVIKENATRTGFASDLEKDSKVDKFLEYIRKKTNKPKYEKDNSEEFWEKYRRWDSLKLTLVDSLVSNSEEFRNIMKEAVMEALEKGGSNDDFEEYIGKYYPGKTILELKRGRIVVGSCSMDDSPRLHALDIAILSAETINWEIFLRAHLNIMNDRFQRVSDGSYAWAGRQTYIKELEELDINVLDLLLGISMRIENPSQNHYYGDIGRLGRALSESKYSNEIEVKMLEMIKDKRLDDYNRMLIYYLFRNYNYFLKDEDNKEQNFGKLEQAISYLPEYLISRIDLDE